MATTQTLLSATTEYLAFLLHRGDALNTRKQRQIALNQLYHAAGDIQIRNITMAHIDKMLSSGKWEPSTYNNKIIHLRAFFKWSRTMGYANRDHDPTAMFRMRKIPNKIRNRIPVQDWPQLFDAAENPIETMMLATGLFLFLRGSEQQGIRVKHVDLANHEIQIYRQKTSEWDTMPISTELAGYMRAHLTWLAERGYAEPDHHLIPQPTRPRPVKQADGHYRYVPGMQDVDPTRGVVRPHAHVKRVLARCGYATFQEGEHTLRRSGARAYFDQLVASGYDGALRRVQAMLGHRNSLMTERYLGLDLDRSTRNDDIAGQLLFPGVFGPQANVVHLDVRKTREVK